MTTMKKSRKKSKSVKRPLSEVVGDEPGSSGVSASASDARSLEKTLVLPSLAVLGKVLQQQLWTQFRAVVVPDESK